MPDEYTQEPLPGLTDPALLTVAERRQARIVELRHRNTARLKELRSHGASIDLGQVALLHVQCLIELALDDEQRAELEELVEQRMSSSLQAALSDLNRLKLLAPQGSSLITPQ